MKVFRKRIISMLLATSMLCSVMPMDAFATEAKESMEVEEVSAQSLEEGICGENAYWKLEGDVLYIYGSGAMYDYGYYSTTELKEAPWKGMSYTEVVIGEGITHVGEEAFFECEVQKAVFPTTLQTIGANAFYGCYDLTKIEIPSVESIGAYSFYLSGIKQIEFPENLRTIGEYAFHMCFSLTEIVFSEGLETIGEGAFSTCWGLTEVIFPESLDLIDYFAFGDCENLKKVVIPSMETSIDSDAFDIWNGNLTIYAYSNSQAHLWAEENGMKFESLSDTVAPTITVSPANGTTITGPITLTVKAADDKGLAKVTMLGNDYPVSGKEAELEITYDPKMFYPGYQYIDVFVTDLAGNQASEWKYFIYVTGPEAPTGFTASENNEGIELRWDYSGEETITGYLLKRSTDGINYEEIASLDRAACSYVDCNTTPGMTYTYWLYPTWSEGIGEAASLTYTCSDRISPQILELSVSHAIAGGTLAPSIFVSAKDNLCLDRVVLYKGLKNGAMEELTVLTGESLSGEFSQNWIWEVEGLKSGSYCVEAVAYDTAGNESSSKRVEIEIDNTAPPALTGFKAQGMMDRIQVLWDTEYQVPEDFAGFEVYRSTNGDGEFEQVSRGTVAGYYDYASSIDAEKTYYYYAVAVDRLGNTSAPTAVVSAQLLKDTESPVIVDMSPRNNETICKEATLKVSATDNYRLDRAVFYYLNGDSWTEIGTVKAKNNTNSTVFSHDWTLPEELYGNVTIKAEVYDVSGSACAIRTQLVNVLAYQEPTAPVVTVENGFQRATLSWNYDMKLLPTLSQFVIYQTDADGGNAKSVGTVARGLKNSYTLSLAKDSVSYYVVEAVDYYGSVARSNVLEVISAPDTTAPVAVLRAAASLASINQEVVFSAELSEDNDGIAAYEWDMNSDGITDATGARCSYCFDTAGTYQVTLTVRDLSGNVDTAQTTVEICDLEIENSNYTEIWITAVNAYDEDRPAVMGAEVTVAIETDQFEVVGFTDKNGLVKLTIPRKDCTVYVAADGFASTTRAVSVDPRNRTGVTVGLMPMDVSVVGGELTVKEMTYEEIVEAGIDVTAPGNEQVFSFQTELTFVAAPGMKGMTVTPISFVNVRGELLNSVNNWLDVSFSEDTNDEENAEGGIILDDNTQIGIPTGKIGFFPISEYFVLVVYGQTHWLKEMFNVELMVINNNYLEPITDCQATLELPTGLSLAEMIEGTQSETVQIGKIGCNGSEEGNTAKVKWYVRGDMEGTYGLSAEVTGMVGQVPFINTFTSEDMIEVYAGEALELTVYADNHTFIDEDYHMTYKLENVSDKSLYNVSLQINKTELSHNFPGINLSTGQLGVNSMVIQKKDLPDDGELHFKELKPGEAIYLDMYCQPLFLSVMNIVDIGPLDLAYYLGKMVTVSSDGSTTSVPCKVVPVEVTHGKLEESFNDAAGDEASEKVVEFAADSYDFGNITAYQKAFKIYKFITNQNDRLNGIPTVVIRMQNSDGEFIDMSGTYSMRTLESKKGTKTLQIYTDSQDYVVEDHGEYSTMTITGDAKIYVVGENPGDASITMTTWAQSYDYNEETEKVDVVKRDICYTADFHVHDMKNTVTAPTCTEQGYTTYQCTGCEENYVADYVDSKGHSYVNGICSSCGDCIGPVITKQPENCQVKMGELFCATVEAEGLNLKYQWYFKNSGSDQWYKSGVRDNTYDDVMTKARAGREIYCVITDVNGNSVTTETVKLIAIPSEKLEIVTQPTDGSAVLGENYCVTVEAKGDGLKYQWYFKNAGSDQWYKSSVKDNTYDDVMTKARAGREIYCVITDAFGNSVETEVAKLVRVPVELEITSQPADAAAALGEMFCATVEAKGDGLKYQWYFKNAGSNQWCKSGVRDNTYDDVMTKLRMNREIYCVITDEWGNSVTTDTVKLIAVPSVELKILTQPTDAHAAMGEDYCVTVEAEGDQVTYRWYFRNAGSDQWYQSGVRDNTYDDVMTKARANRDVYCVVTDMFGNQVTTEIVTLVLEK